MSLRLGLALCLLLGACSAHLEGFDCQSSASCGPDRSCVERRCAAPDTTCASGLRWDDSAGAQEGMCTADGAMADVPGEAIVLAPGWTAAMWRDFSGDYVFRANDFPDQNATNMEVYDNAPRAIVPLSSPFGAGFAVVAGRQILELPAGGAAPAILHDYTPTSANVFPHRPMDLHFAAPANAFSGGLYIAAQSLGNGDGIFQIDSNWTMSYTTGPAGVPIDNNNCEAVAFDPVGDFASTGVASTYYGSDDPGVYVARVSDGVNVYQKGDANAGIADLEILSGGRMAVAMNEAQQSSGHVLELTNGGAVVRDYTALTRSQLRLVTGDLARLSPGIHVIDRTRIVVVNADDTLEQIAESQGMEWKWIAAAVPPAGHPDGARVAYFVLESNRARNLDRILVISRP